MLDIIRRKKIAGQDFFSYPSRGRHKKVVDYYYENLPLLGKDIKKIKSEFSIGFGIYGRIDILGVDRFNRLCMIEVWIDYHDKNISTGKKSLEKYENILKEIVINTGGSLAKIPKYRLFLLSITHKGNILREMKPAYIHHADDSEVNVIDFIKKAWEAIGGYYIKNNKKEQGLGERLTFTSQDIEFLRRIRSAMEFLGWKTGNGKGDSGIWIRNTGTGVLYYNLGEDFFEKVRPRMKRKYIQTFKEALKWLYYGKKCENKVKYFESIIEIVEEMK